MQDHRAAIWIQPASPSPVSACGTCAQPAAADGGALPPPELRGDAAALARVLSCLAVVHEPQQVLDIVASGRVQAVEVGDGEATLTLRMGQGLCVDAHWLAERAFEAMREALPDTDIYLRHDRPAGCAGRA
jgi:Iron-sulfur cluster assembly protein